MLLNSLRSLAAGAVIALTALPALALEGGACATRPEQTGLTARVVQSRLMVGALICNQKDEYRQFVTKFQGNLATQGAAMTHYFNRVYGKGASAKLNGFVTELANDASHRSMGAQSASYCQQSGALFKEVLASSSSDFEKLAQEDRFSEAHGIKLCDKQLAKNE